MVKKLNKSDQAIANAVFYHYAKRNFAKGVYESTQPLTTTTACVTTAVPTTVLIGRTVECTANVPGLDQETFILALEEFLELSRQKTFDILAENYGSK